MVRNAVAFGLAWLVSVVMIGAAAAQEPVPVDPGVALPEPPKIVWHLQNPFRFFTDPTDTEVHRATYAALLATERESAVLSAERALSQRHDHGWAETMIGKTCWDTKINRYVCPGRKDYINPESHAVVVEVMGIADDAVDCRWLTAPRGNESGRGKVVTQHCDEPLVVDVPYPRGMGVTLEVGGREVARQDIVVRDILVAAMGDSFGSGEGNPDVPVRFSRDRVAEYGKANGDSFTGLPARVGDWKNIGDTAFRSENAQWLDQACHRSLYSHQLRAALQLAVEDPHRAVTFVGLACSGAEVTFGLFLRYKGNEWVSNPPDLSQISALADAQCGRRDADAIDMPEAYHMKGTIPELQGGLVLKKCPVESARNIDLLMVSVGGNDIGFARLVANSVLADDSVVKRLGGWFGQVHGNMESQALLDRLDERYKALNRALHGILHIPWEQSDRIILTAYPPLAVLGDGSGVCPDGNAGMEVYSDFNLSQRRARDGTQLADKLQKVMTKSAAIHGWSLADSHRKAFVGRGICAGFTDNAFTNADDLRMPRKVADKWVPYNPADYQPYVSRQRWFRTPNDAFMTGNFHAIGGVTQQALSFQSLARFQVLLASTYSGAFHPTAEGHAAIADAVADRARRVLQKYGQTSDAAVPPDR